MVLFCCELVADIYTGLFQKAWNEANYTRTTSFKTKAAGKFLPQSIDDFNAKCIFLDNVPSHERWYAAGKDSTNGNLCPFNHNVPKKGLTSVAAGMAGQGRIVWLSDVNAEEDTCTILVSLAQAIFPDEHLSGSDSDNSVSYRDVA